MTKTGHGEVAKAALLTEEEQAQSVVIADPGRDDMAIIFVSDEFETQTGYPAEEVLGRNCRFLQGADTEPAAAQAIRDAIADEREISIDILNYRKDGTPFWNRLRIRPLYDDNGKLLYFAGAQNPIDAGEAKPIGA
ncbi:MAG: PAS domain-containing protein [Bauldia litoralis]